MAILGGIVEKSDRTPLKDSIDTITIHNSTTNSTLITVEFVLVFANVNLRTAFKMNDKQIITRRMNAKPMADCT